MSVKISEDFTLNYFEENKVTNHKIVILECHFSFFNKHYLVYLEVDSLNNEKIKFPCIEGSGILMESFEEQIESIEIQEIIRENAKQFIRNSDYINNID